jgi:excisionase family DNA binding protein
METVINNPNNLLTVSEAARELGVSEQTVRTYESRKRLPAERLANGTRLFRREDVAAFKKSRGK